MLKSNIYHLHQKIWKYDLRNGGCHLDLYSLSSKTSYRQILWSLKDVQSNTMMIISLWNLTDILVNFRMIEKSLNPDLAALRLHKILQ